MLHGQKNKNKLIFEREEIEAGTKPSSSHSQAIPKS